MGFSFKFDNSFFGVLEGKISGVFVFNYCLFFFVRFVIRIIFMLSMYRLILLMINMVVVIGVFCWVYMGEMINDLFLRKLG